MGIPIQWPLVLFTLVAGTGAGLIAAACVAEFAGLKDEKLQFKAGIVALVLLVAGGCFSLLHLASPGNVMAAVTNIGSFSGISMELILLGATFIAALVYLIVVKRAGFGVASKVIGVVTIIAALLFMFYSGHGYIMESRPAWNTTILPLAYLGTSLATGAFLFALLQALAKEPGSFKAVKIILLVSAISCACVCAAWAVSIKSTGAASPVMYWGGLVICGIVAALALGCFAFLKLDESNAKVWTAVGVVVFLIATLAVRVLMWQAGDGFLDLFSSAAGGAITAWLP